MTDPLPPYIFEMLGNDMMDNGDNRDFPSEWNQLLPQSQQLHKIEVLNSSMLTKRSHLKS